VLLSARSGLYYRLDLGVGSSPTARGLDIKAGAAKLKADRAARVEAEAVILRWNDLLSRGRDMLWSPTIRGRADRRNALARRLLSGLRDEPGYRSAHPRPSPAGLGGTLVLGLRLLVSGVAADAEADQPDPPFIERRRASTMERLRDFFSRHWPSAS
jgi:hypothetical protein